MYNLFIIHELAEPEENLHKVKEACQSLGNSTPLFQSCWYVNSPFNADEAVKRIGGAFSKEDKVVFINTTTDSCSWLGIEEAEARRIKQNWKMSLKMEEQ